MRHSTRHSIYHVYLLLISFDCFFQRCRFLVERMNFVLLFLRRMLSPAVSICMQLSFIVKAVFGILLKILTLAISEVNKHTLRTK